MSMSLIVLVWVLAILLARLLVPAGQKVEQGFGWFHQFQQGLTQHYVLYNLITVILMLSALIPFDEFFVRLFAS